jgi:hypothetical protein
MVPVILDMGRPVGSRLHPLGQLRLALGLELGQEYLGELRSAKGLLVVLQVREPRRLPLGRAGPLPLHGVGTGLKVNAVPAEPEGLALPEPEGQGRSPAGLVSACAAAVRIRVASSRVRAFARTRVP